MVYVFSLPFTKKTNKSRCSCQSIKRLWRELSKHVFFMHSGILDTCVCAFFCFFFFITNTVFSVWSLFMQPSSPSSYVLPDDKYTANVRQINDEYPILFKSPSMRSLFNEYIWHTTELIHFPWVLSEIVLLFIEAISMEKLSISRFQFISRIKCGKKSFVKETGHR